MSELRVRAIVKWHHDRNLIDGATDAGQFKKLMSEFGELSDNLAKGECVKDDIGDMAVVLINIAERNNFIGRLKEGNYYLYNPDYLDLLTSLYGLGFAIYEGEKSHLQNSLGGCIECCWNWLRSFAESLNLNFSDCLDIAYNDIKDRKGKMINGTFVKESDL